jgi:hypothetical protein
VISVGGARLLNHKPLLPSCPLSKRPLMLLLLEDLLTELLAVLLLPMKMSADAVGPEGRPSLDKPRLPVGA